MQPLRSPAAPAIARAGAVATGYPGRCANDGTSLESWIPPFRARRVRPSGAANAPTPCYTYTVRNRFTAAQKRRTTSRPRRQVMASAEMSACWSRRRGWTGRPADCGRPARDGEPTRLGRATPVRRAPILRPASSSATPGNQCSRRPLGDCVRPVAGCLCAEFNAPPGLRGRAGLAVGGDSGVVGVRSRRPSHRPRRRRPGRVESASCRRGCRCRTRRSRSPG